MGGKDAQYEFTPQTVLKETGRTMLTTKMDPSIPGLQSQSKTTQKQVLFKVNDTNEDQIKTLQHHLQHHL